jgi:hypothetical protein
MPEYGDIVTWGVKVEGHETCWVTDGPQYRYLCTDPDGVHVLQTIQTGGVFSARHVKKL